MFILFAFSNYAVENITSVKISKNMSMPVRWDETFIWKISCHFTETSTLYWRKVRSHLGWSRRAGSLISYMTINWILYALSKDCWYHLRHRLCSRWVFSLVGLIWTRLKKVWDFTIWAIVLERQVELFSNLTPPPPLYVALFTIDLIWTWHDDHSHINIDMGGGWGGAWGRISCRKIGDKMNVCWRL